MSTTESGYRVMGAFAALGGLVVMMCAASPSPTSLGWGLAGLAVFFVSRLAPHRRQVAPPRPDPAEIAPVSRAEDTGPSMHPLLSRPVRRAVGAKPVSYSKVSLGRGPWIEPVPSSVLPPSRAPRSATPSASRSAL